MFGSSRNQAKDHAQYAVRSTQLANGAQNAYCVPSRPNLSSVLKNPTHTPRGGLEGEGCVFVFLQSEDENGLPTCTARFFLFFLHSKQKRKERWSVFTSTQHGVTQRVATTVFTLVSCAGALL